MGRRMSHYWTIFTTLLVVPFEHVSLIWGIVPLYFALLLNETTSAKVSFRTAVQTGFSFIWCGAQWLYLFCHRHTAEPGGHPFIQLMVTFLVLGLGVVALISGVRRRYPRYGSFLGHTRFANYFMIMIFPMQSHFLSWTWERLLAIVLFAVPAWLLLHFGLMPIRDRR